MKKTITLQLPEFVKIYEGEKWNDIGRWKIMNLPFSIYVKAADKKYYERYGVPVEPVSYLYVEDDCYLSASSQDGLTAFFKEKLASGGFRFFESILEKQGALFKALEKQQVELVHLTKAGEEISAQFLREVLENALELTASFEFDRCLNPVFEEAIVARFDALGLPSGDLLHLITEDSSTDTARFHAETQRLARAKKAGIAADELDAALASLAEKYGYLGAYLFTGKEYTKEDMARMVERVSSEEKTAHEPPRYTDVELNGLIAMANKYAHNRLKRVEVLNKSLFRFEPLLRLMAERHPAESYEHILSWHLEELVAYVESGYETPGRTALTLGTSLSTGEVDYFLESEETKAFKRDYIDKDLSSITEVRGQSAYPGVVKGSARIVLGDGDFSKFKEGDVLVCSMTNPNYVMLMQKAVGFVTDKGGILCHAAIIAREMKKPCVIGTRNATKVFRDGDQIIVDADTGAVRKVS